jgi:hypothetical protein
MNHKEHVQNLHDVAKVIFDKKLDRILEVHTPTSDGYIASIHLEAEEFEAKLEGERFRERFRERMCSDYPWEVFVILDKVKIFSILTSKEKLNWWRE